MDSNSIQKKLDNHTPDILGNETFSKFAVLIPLIEKAGELHVLFEVRSHKMRRQPGEICFPGGKIDRKDKTEQDAAIRETTEELGITSHAVKDVRPVDYLVSPFGMVVYPYVGFIDQQEDIQPNPAEVEEAFLVPLSFFLETEPQVHRINVTMEPEKDFPVDMIVGGDNYDWRPVKMDEFFYVYEDKVIWGLTAKILTHFIELLQK